MVQKYLMAQGITRTIPEIWHEKKDIGSPLIMYNVNLKEGWDYNQHSALWENYIYRIKISERRLTEYAYNLYRRHMELNISDGRLIECDMNQLAYYAQMQNPNNYDTDGYGGGGDGLGGAALASAQKYYANGGQYIPKKDDCISSVSTETGKRANRKLLLTK